MTIFTDIGQWFEGAGNTVYNSVLKPTYNSVLKPVGTRIWNFADRTLDRVEGVSDGIANLIQSPMTIVLLIGGVIVLSTILKR